MIQQALTDERGLAGQGLDFAPGALEGLVRLVDGDARRALNYLELLADLAVEQGGKKLIDPDLLAAVSGERVARFDKA